MDKINKARDLLGEKYKDATTEQIESLVSFIKGFCHAIINNHTHNTPSDGDAPILDAQLDKNE